MESYAKFAKERLSNRIVEIDNKIEKYIKSKYGDLIKGYHSVSDKGIDLFADYILRPAKRLRGSFIIEAYSMFQPTSSIDKIYDVSIAIEMIHAYLLLIDDFNDKSDIRRTQPTGHRIFEQYFKDNNLRGDAQHFGYSLSTLSSLIGMHHAINLIIDMDIEERLKTKIIKTINDTVNITAVGQSRDIFNGSDINAIEESVIKVHEYKTAYYTYHNPIQLGCILANQPDDTLDKFKGYTIPAGIAFQIQDDILGVFGDPKDTGKSNMDDIVEGKATLLTTYARQKSNSNQLKILNKGLGNRDLDQKTFKDIQNIIIETKALEYSKQKALELVTSAKEHMYKAFGEYKDTDGFKFIVGIADYMIERKL